MKFISSALALLLAIAPVAVQSHSTEVSFCVTANLDLRIFVEHWHDNYINAGSLAGTLDFTDNNIGPSSRVSLAPVGVVLDTTRADLASAGGCAGATTMVTTCSLPTLYNDWVYYDFPMGTCGNPVSYTVQTGSGTTDVLYSGCGTTLLPATIAQTIDCPPGVETSEGPSSFPSGMPSSMFSSEPSTKPSTKPSTFPSFMPSSMPSMQPSSAPSSVPTTTKQGKKARRSSGKSGSMSMSMSSSVKSLPVGGVAKTGKSIKGQDILA